MVILFALIPSAHAQNLLTNPDLEGLDGFPIPPGSCAQPGNWYYAYNCIPEIEPPTWWYPFWNSGPSAVDPDTDYRRPEFRVYSWPDGPHYAYNGSRYLVFFGFYGAIDAGIYQQVSVTPGQTYEFSYQGFAWSNCMAGKEDPSGAGCFDFPPYQAVFKAGIDPLGGTDYASPGIVWSSGDSVYDVYERVAVIAQAQSNTLTVFVRCTFWHNYIQHNDAHVDALALVPIGATIELEPESIVRSVFPGDSLSSSVFTVTNGSDIIPLHYTITENAAWLSLNPTSGTSTGESDPITITYDVDALPLGEYVAEVTVSSQDAVNSPQKVIVQLSVESVGPDFDSDGDVDLDDYGHLQRCLTGIGISPTDPGCLDALLDGDGDVDVDDVILFTNCLSGPRVPVDPNCEN